MKYLIKCSLSLSILFFVAFCPVAWASAGTGEVLVLHSYNPEYAWTRAIQRSLEAGFREQGFRLSAYYLDAKRHQDPDYIDKYLYGLMKHKLSAKRFDLIIVSDNVALDFVLTRRQELVGDAPVVFCGVNEFSPSLIRGHRNVTGVAETISAKKTLGVIFRLHPEVSRVILVGNAADVSTFKCYEKIMSIVPGFRERSTFEFWSLPSDALLRKLGSLEKGSAVVYIGGIRNREGKALDLTDVLRMMRGSCSVPIYSFWEFMAGKGIVGGKLLSAKKQGEVAGTIALEILGGVDPAHIPVRQDEGSAYIFDFNELSRFGVPMDALPPGSSIINRPPVDYSVKKPLLWAMIGVLAALFGGVLFLLVTKRIKEQAQAELIRSEERYRIVAGQKGQMVYDYEIDTGRIAWRGDTLGITGYSEEEFQEVGIGEWEKMIHPDDAALAVELLGASMENGGQYRAEYRFRNSSGGYAHIEDTGVFLEEGSSGYSRMLGIMKDISARKASEEALRQSEQKYRQVYENSLDGFVFVDMERNFLEFNSSYLKMTGYTREELMGRNVSLLTPDKWAPLDLRIFREEVLKTGHSRIYEKEYVRKDGTLVPVELRSGLVRADDGTPRGIWAFVRDISKRKESERQQQRLEKQLFQVQKMESLGVLAGGIAHDFNNILGGIIGYAELIKMSEDSPAGPVSRRIDKLLLSANRAKELVSQILAFSRKSVENRRQVLPVPIIEETLKLIRASLPASVKIRSKIRPVKGTVMGEPTQLYRVMMNLYTNAAHAMRKGGGTLEVGIREVSLPGKGGAMPTDPAPGEYVNIYVSDTGEGIDSAVIDRIFEPFFTTKEVGEGTGMGLSMVHGIVSGSGGTITVKNNPVSGARFDLFLPLIRTTELPGTEENTSVKFSEGRGKILLVDDETSIMEATTEILEILGYEVTAESDSDSALERFMKGPESFDMVITDYTMPGVDGTVLASRLKKIRPDIPVMLCTGGGRKIDEEKAGVMGIDAFMRKPVGAREFADAVRDLLEKRA